MLWALGTRSIAALGVLAGTAYALARAGLFRADYWQQLTPWVAFLACALGVLASALVFQFWRLDDESEHYIRFGERLPFGGGGEVALLPGRGSTVLVGKSPLVHVRDFPPAVRRVLFVATFLGIGLLTFDNRAISLVREIPDGFDRQSADFCAEPEPPSVAKAARPGCKLVERAYKLGYLKSLGSCAPKEEDDDTLRDVCRKRQLDEPYLHYQARRFERDVAAIIAGDDEAGMVERLEQQLEHVEELNAATLDSIGMAPRASHHVFTNLPDPSTTRPWSARARTSLESNCTDRLHDLPHFPAMPDTPSGRSALFEHVLAQLLFNPLYRPIVAQCQEVEIHWGAPDDACARLAADPVAFLGDLDRDALAAVTGMIERRERRATLALLQPTGVAVPPVQRVVSLQCLMVDDANVKTDATAPAPARALAAARPPPPPTTAVARPVTMAGATLSVRETRIPALGVDGASQIRLYKHVAELLAESFGYGRLTSAQAVGAAPEEATIAASFRDPRFLLTKLDLLRDADLFLGNEWLADRPDLLEVYPYHVHLENFVQTFRRSYGQTRGRL